MWNKIISIVITKDKLRLVFIFHIRNLACCQAKCMYLIVILVTCAIAVICFYPAAVRIAVHCVDVKPAGYVARRRQARRSHVIRVTCCFRLITSTRLTNSNASGPTKVSQGEFATSRSLLPPGLLSAPGAGWAGAVWLWDSVLHLEQRTRAVTTPFTNTLGDAVPDDYLASFYRTSDPRNVGILLANLVKSRPVWKLTITLCIHSYFCY